MLRVIYCRMDV